MIRLSGTLTPDEAQEISTAILERLGIMEPEDYLVKIIADLGTSIEGLNAKKEGFVLESVLGSLNVRPNEKVFINWYQFDKIDEMRFVDLNKYLDDIWYPGSDDIDILDATFSWILSIDHHGYVKYLAL